MFITVKSESNVFILIRQCDVNSLQPELGAINT